MLDRVAIKKILIVGCGLSGCVIARELAEAGYLVDIIDKRPHVAGNCYDYEDEHGIRIHKYGPHIFHTSNQKTFDWMSRFTEWVDYEHKVLALLADGNFVPFPPNDTTLKSVSRENLVDTFYRPYSEKMWGQNIEKLDQSILSRVPIRDGDEDRYFPTDKYQKLPKNGYTQVVKRILAHNNITVHLNRAFQKSMEGKYDHIFNSMPIDEYYDYCFGDLPYRSIKFDLSYLHNGIGYPAAVVNFTDDGPHTRVTEWKKFPGHCNKTTPVSAITKERPCDYRDNDFERYYPVKDKDGANRVIYNRYRKIPKDKMTFIGRCGMYVYIDMDQAVSSSLAVSRAFFTVDNQGVR